MARVRADELRIHDDLFPVGQLTITPCLSDRSKIFAGIGQQFRIDDKRLALACSRNGSGQTSKRKEWQWLHEKNIRSLRNIGGSVQVRKR